jgi:hypothetical protein
MSAQAVQMKDYVRNLIDIIGSGESRGVLDLLARRGKTDDDYEMMEPPEAYEETEQYLSETASGEKAPEKAPKSKKAKEVRPHDVIPMDDDDFEDF